MGEAYKWNVTALFYSEKETEKEAQVQIRELCLHLGDRFEGILKVERMEAAEGAGK